MFIRNSEMLSGLSDFSQSFGRDVRAGRVAYRLFSLFMPGGEPEVSPTTHTLGRYSTIQ